MYSDQSHFDVRCEWGEAGVRALGPTSDVVVIVDVLSFSTSVDVATARGATVYPYRFKDDSAVQFARSVGAILAVERDAAGLSLSAASLMKIEPGTRLVLPSQNGATLTLMTQGKPTLAGALRNCRAVAIAAARMGRRIVIVPAGERWEDGTLRPA